MEERMVEVTMFFNHFNLRFCLSTKTVYQRNVRISTRETVRPNCNYSREVTLINTGVNINRSFLPLVMKFAEASGSQHVLV